jgi:hypothetical protein
VPAGFSLLDHGRGSRRLASPVLQTEVCEPPWIASSFPRYASRMQDWRDVSVWQRLAAEGGALVAAADAALAQAESVPAPSVIARFRKSHDAALVAAAFELVAARRKARAKFSAADMLWCDVAGVEQASDERVAAWKAARMRETLGDGASIQDICSGIGGDALALAAAGLAVTALDLDPRRAWMTAQNARCASECGDAEALHLAGAALHADPARRDEVGGARSWSLDDHKPGRAWIERVLREARAAAVKFAPGVDRRDLGDLPLEWEWIESDGALVQAVAWSGAFARAPRSTCATRLSRSGSAVSISGLPDDARGDRIGVDPRLEPGMFVAEPVAALERAQLLTEATQGTAARELARSLGLVAASSPLPAPWFGSFAFVDECGRDPAEIARAIERHGLVARSVRVRGRALDADAVTRAIHARGDGNAVVFAWREGSGVRVVLTRVTS